MFSLEGRPNLKLFERDWKKAKKALNRWKVSREDIGDSIVFVCKTPEFVNSVSVYFNEGFASKPKGVAHVVEHLVARDIFQRFEVNSDAFMFSSKTTIRMDIPEIDLDEKKHLFGELSKGLNLSKEIDVEKTRVINEMFKRSLPSAASLVAGIAPTKLKDIENINFESVEAKFDEMKSNLDLICISGKRTERMLRKVKTWAGEFSKGVYKFKLHQNRPHLKIYSEDAKETDLLIPTKHAFDYYEFKLAKTFFGKLIYSDLGHKLKSEYGFYRFNLALEDFFVVFDGKRKPAQYLRVVFDGDEIDYELLLDRISSLFDSVILKKVDVYTVALDLLKTQMFLPLYEYRRKTGIVEPLDELYYVESYKSFVEFLEGKLESLFKKSKRLLQSAKGKFEEYTKQEFLKKFVME